MFSPSGVTFTERGPQLSASSLNSSRDLELMCNDTVSTGVTDLRVANGVQVARVTGTPDAASCASAVKLHPLSVSAWTASSWPMPQTSN